MVLLDTMYRHRSSPFGKSIRSPVFRPLYSPYRIEQCWACTVLPPLERFLRDESRTGAAQPFVCRNPFVDGFGSKADMCSALGDVRFAPESGHVQCNWGCPLSANSDQTRCSKPRPYSITLSARASSVGGIVRPSALAVFRLMNNSYLVGACTGRSNGFSPLRIRST